MILGIWDGHDAGAAIVDKNQIKIAVNEERLTRRKLDVGFPSESIKCCLNYLGLKPGDIDLVATCTSDFSKTMTRVFPKMKDKYYLLRRRKIYPKFAQKQKDLKYKLTEIGSSYPTKKISETWLRKGLNKLGFKDYKMEILDHHMAHAAGAGLCSGFDKSLVITIDGVGDGLSGSINIFDKGNIERISVISAKHSLGIFFEHITNLLGMRELEDEGKVMALSDFAYPIPDENNEMLDFFEVNGLDIKAKYSSTKMWDELRKILWHNPPEQFAWMAQETLERKVIQLFKNALKETGLKDVAWAGGVASNVKANMKIRRLPEVDKWFVFPHMGDGGLALGAALLLNFEKNGIWKYKFDNVYLGPEYTGEEIENELKKNKMNYTHEKSIEKLIADLVVQNKIVFLYQGRMEFGPRALGNRSILASASSLESKNDLNLKIKKRVWYQPFCPSILDEDAKKIFADYDYTERFMTMGFMVKKEYRKKMAAVVNVDGSARPQMVTNENPTFKQILKDVKKKTGLGALLNTSFNLHGYPIVNTPNDATHVMKKSKNHYMAIGNYLVEL
jgi:carbamoyltransferase